MSLEHLQGFMEEICTVSGILGGKASTATASDWLDTLSFLLKSLFSVNRANYTHLPGFLWGF